MTDPMDHPPASDYGSDRYDYIEVINAPDGVDPPAGLLLDLGHTACPDCRANVFIRYDQPGQDWPPAAPHVDDQGRRWFVVIAHDESCPSCPA